MLQNSRMVEAKKWLFTLTKLLAQQNKIDLAHRDRYWVGKFGLKGLYQHIYLFIIKTFSTGSKSRKPYLCQPVIQPRTDLESREVITHNYHRPLKREHFGFSEFLFVISWIDIVSLKGTRRYGENCKRK